RLGVRVRLYDPHHYGLMEDAQNGALDSDRLIAEWNLLEEEPKWQGDLQAVEKALEADEDGFPLLPVLGLADPVVHVRVPETLSDLLKNDLPRAQAWRQAVRDALMHYFGRGYTATRFLEH